MAATIDWSFFGLDDPLARMEKACSFTPSTDPSSAAFWLEDIGVLPEYTEKYTSMPYPQMGSFLDTPVVSTNEACKSFDFANAWNNLTTPPMTPPYNFLSMPADFAVETVDMNDVLARDVSPASSLYADGDDITAHSPTSMKRSYHSASSSPSNSGVDEDYHEELPAAKHPKRRPGRPRLDRMPTSSSTSSSTSSRTESRVPHNQVERKYREGLNAQLERLRRAVPALCQVGGGERGKPSKANVLTGAIAYIKMIRQERDELARQVEEAKNAGMGVEDVEDVGVWQ